MMTLMIKMGMTLTMISCDEIVNDGINEIKNTMTSTTMNKTVKALTMIMKAVVTTMVIASTMIELLQPITHQAMEVDLFSTE